MIIDASFKNDGSQAILTSPAYTKLSDTGCLTFWYHMWGADMGTLNVTMKKGSQSYNIWAISGNQGNQWRKFSKTIDLSGSSTFQIVFTGVVSHSNGDYAEVLGDIAIDDVSVDRSTSCSSINTPSTPRMTTPKTTSSTTIPSTSTVKQTTVTAGKVADSNMN